MNLIIDYIIIVEQFTTYIKMSGRGFADEIKYLRGYHQVLWHTIVRTKACGRRVYYIQFSERKFADRRVFVGRELAKSLSYIIV